MPRSTATLDRNVRRLPYVDAVVELSPDAAEILALQDRQRARLVLAMVDAIGGRHFNARELWQYASVNPALRSAFDQAGITSPRRLGKRLRLLAGRSYSGLQVQCAKRENVGELWTVQVVDDLHEASSAE